MRLGSRVLSPLISFLFPPTFPETCLAQIHVSPKYCGLLSRISPLGYYKNVTSSPSPYCSHILSTCHPYAGILGDYSRATRGNHSQLLFDGALPFWVQDLEGSRDHILRVRTCRVRGHMSLASP